MADETKQETFLGTRLPSWMHADQMRIRSIERELLFYKVDTNNATPSGIIPVIVNYVNATHKNPGDYDPEVLLLTIGNLKLKPGNIANVLYEDTGPHYTLNEAVERAIEFETYQPVKGHLITVGSGMAKLPLAGNSFQWSNTSNKADGIIVSYDFNIVMKEEEK